MGYTIWVCLKMLGSYSQLYIYIAIFRRDNDQQNHWVQWGLAYFQTHPCVSLFGDFGHDFGHDFGIFVLVQLRGFSVFGC